MRTALMFSLLLSTLWGADCSVVLRAVHVDGSPADYEVSSFKDEDGKEFSDRFTGLRGRVPCQLVAYRFALHLRGASAQARQATMIVGTIWANDPANWLTVSTPNVYVSPDRQHAGNPDGGGLYEYWKGRIEPRPKERLWIHMRSMVPTVNSVADIDAEVDDAGGFKVYGGVLKGLYTVYVTSPKGEIIHTELVKMQNSFPREMVISIPATVPSPRLIK